MNILLGDDHTELNEKSKVLFNGLFEHLKQLSQKVDEHTATLEKLAKEDEACKRIATLPGVGPITSTAIIAKIGNGSEFRNGRELSAYLGLTPRQASSGETQRLLGISKHGDRYVRQLLIHGGRSSLKVAMKKNKETGIFEKQDEHSEWIRNLAERIGKNKTSVAVANKNARMIVALLKNESVFQAKLAH